MSTLVWPPPDSCDGQFLLKRFNIVVVIVVVVIVVIIIVVVVVLKGSVTIERL